jgi:hypothetical protein
VHDLKSLVFILKLLIGSEIGRKTWLWVRYWCPCSPEDLSPSRQMLFNLHENGGHKLSSSKGKQCFHLKRAVTREGSESFVGSGLWN